jgi:hypothetical protein
MSLTELIGAAKALTPQEQVDLIDALNEDRRKRMEEEFVKQFEGMSEIPMYTPIGCEEVAFALQELLEQHNFALAKDVNAEPVE